MKRMRVTRWVCLFLCALFCVSLPVGRPIRAEASAPEGKSITETAVFDRLLTLDGGSWSTAEGSGHLQGICCDDELNYMYFSFTDRLIKVDMRTGERVGTVTGLAAGSISSGAHLGCLAYYNGYVYGSLEYKKDERWYIAAFDADRIQGDMHYTDPGVMYAIHVPDVDEEYKDELDAGEHKNSASSMGHRYGTGGIDGITFGTLPGAGLDSKTYMIVTYGPYGNASRYDNNNQVLLVYDPEAAVEFMLPFSEDRREAEGLRFEQQLFVYTGNQTYGIQNLEYDKTTGDLWLMCYGRPEGSAFPKGNMYVVDGSVPLYRAEVEVGQSVPASNPDQAAALSKAACYMKNGSYPIANHMTLKCTCGKGGLEHHELTDYGNTGHPVRICIRNNPASAETGFISLGNDYYYIAHSGSETIDGVKYQWGSASLYRLDRKSNVFERITDPPELLLSYTMDAADTYEKDGQVWLKDVSGNGCDALVDGTYAAEDLRGKTGGALGFRGYLQGAIYDRVSMSDATMEFINEQVEDGFSYSFWVYNEREMDRFTPIIGMYRSDGVQEGLYAGVFEWRYRSSPAVVVHRYTNDPDYRTLADGTVYIARPGTNGGDASGYLFTNSASGLIGKWLHIVVVRVGSAVTVYCNGERTNCSEASVTDATLDGLTHFEMGGAVIKSWKDSNNRTRFSGKLDDVRLYSGALSSVDARLLYEAGPAASGESGCGAVAESKDISFGEYSGTVLSEQKGPVLHYRMNDIGSIYDVSGSGKDAIATCWVSSSDNREGQAGMALAFDGHQFTKPAKISISADDTAWLSSQLNGTGKLTISFWMKATHENGHRMAILGIYDKSGRPMGVFETRGRLGQDVKMDGKFAIGFAAARPYVSGECDEATYEQLCVTNTTKDGSGDYGDKIVGTWYHVVGELDQTANIMRLYVDGELVQEKTIASDTLGEIGYFLMGTSAGRYYSYENAANGNENRTDRQGWAMRGDYVGVLDDVRIYNRILSADEVEALYEAGTAERRYAVADVTALDGSGAETDQLPQGDFTACVTLSRGEIGDTALVLLAAYREDGQLLNVWFLEDTAVDGNAVKLKTEIPNEEGEVALLRAFLISSLSDPMPLGTPFVFPGT